MFVDISLRFIARDFRVDLFKARAIARFRNQFTRGQKTIGIRLNETTCSLTCFKLKLP